MHATAVSESRRAIGKSARWDQRARSLAASVRTSSEKDSVGSKRRTSAMDGSSRSDSCTLGSPRVAGSLASALDMIDLFELQRVEACDHLGGLHHALRHALV